MRQIVLMLLVLLWAPIASAQPSAYANRAEAIKALADPAADRRAEAVIWIARNGTGSDDRVLRPRLADDDPQVRDLAEQAMWRLWGRSGDAAVDVLMAQGDEALSAGQLEQAIAIYASVIRSKPAYAEGWNKRATAYFLAGDFKRSLADCDQVMKRKSYHFGALAGYGQIYFQMKRYDKAIGYWRRALDANPNMTGMEANIETAQKLLVEQRKHSA